MAVYSTEIIAGPEGKLELIREAPVDDGPLAGSDYYAVVCHPHPLYGGAMDNKVVTTVSRIYRELGVPVARFNFRGVGASEGVHDNAEGEVEDLQAVASWLQKQCSGTRLLIAGYSFGSVVAEAGSSMLTTDHLVLIAPPVERYSFAPDQRFTCPAIIVLGEEDELVGFQHAKQWAESLASPVKIIAIAEASHFFHGELVSLRDQLTPMLLTALG